VLAEILSEAALRPYPLIHRIRAEVVDAGREHISILHRMVERDFDEVTARAPEGEGVRAVQLAESGHDVGVNRLGIDATREGGLGFAFPVVIVSGVKPRG
jgi:hypothetical protein